MDASGAASPPIDVDRARRETPGCAEVVHLNNAGASLPTRRTVDRVIDHLELEARIGGYEAAAVVEAERAGVHDAVGRLLGADASEIALTTNATEAWWRAFSAVPLAPGDRVLVGRSEYVANAFGLIQARDRGVVVEVIADDSTGQIDLDALAAAMDDRVRLVALTHVPTSGGLVNPAAEVGAIAKEHGALYLIDACQSAGQLPLDVDHIGCDFLAFTGRKFLRGPRGTGALYARTSVLDQLLDPVFIDGTSATWVTPDRYELAPGAARYEVFEAPVAAQLGLGVAVEEALAWGIDAIAERVGALALRLRGLLDEVPGVTVLDQGRRRCGIVTFTVDGHPSAEVGAALRAARINTSVASPGSAQFDLGQRGITDAVRASVHYFTTDAELDTLITELHRIV